MWLPWLSLYVMFVFIGGCWDEIDGGKSSSSKLGVNSRKNLGRSFLPPPLLSRVTPMTKRLLILALDRDEGKLRAWAFTGLAIVRWRVDGAEAFGV